MATVNEIRDRLIEMAGTYAPAVSVLAKVKSVDEDECTCVLVDDDGQEFFEVRIRPITGKNKYFLQIPKNNSFVLAVRIEDTEEWQIVACDEVKKVQLIVGDIEVVISETDILMNGGELGGLIKISELTAKLNELVSKFNAHTHVVNTTGSATTQTGTAASTLQLANSFNKSDYENIIIKH